MPLRVATNSYTYKEKTELNIVSRYLFDVDVNCSI